MLSKKMLNAINEQINKELYSSYLYLAMSAYLGSINLKGFANWMRAQAQEEHFHAMKFYDYIYTRGERVILKSIDTPPTEWESIEDIFSETLNHEKNVTKMIDNLVSIASSEQDYATNSFLQWYVDEQVEEEASADEVLQQIKMIKNNSGALFMLDKELGNRTFK